MTRKLTSNLPDHTVFTKPSDGTPLYGDLFLYGSSERRSYPCLGCSDPNGWLLVAPSELAEHHEAHVRGWAMYQEELRAGNTEPQ
jgi:hypothetical protein